MIGEESLRPSHYCIGDVVLPVVQETTKVHRVYLSRVTLVSERVQTDSSFGFLCLEREVSQRYNRNSQTDQTGLVLIEVIQSRSTGEGETRELQQGY